MMLKTGRDLFKCLVAAGRCSLLQSRLPTCGTTLIRRSYGDHGSTVGGGRDGGKGDDDDDGFVKPGNYKVFKDDDSSVILDVEEERALLDSQLSADDTRSNFDEIDQFAGFDMSREFKFQIYRPDTNGFGLRCYTLGGICRTADNYLLCLK